MRLCGSTLTGDSPVLLTVTLNPSGGKAKIKANSDSTILSLRIPDDVKRALLSSE